MSAATMASDVPFVLPQTLSSGMRMGLGKLFAVTVAANTDVTVAHDLGRIPHFVIPLDNGTAYVPAIRRSTVTAWTTSNVTFQANAAMTACWVWIV
jgi:predicted RecA/RadA family phage recombinase